MSSEAELVLGVWDSVRDHLPHAKRAEVAKDVLYAFADWFDANDLASIVDEDPDLKDAFEDVFPPLENDDEDVEDE